MTLYQCRIGLASLHQKVSDASHNHRRSSSTGMCCHSWQSRTLYYVVQPQYIRTVYYVVQQQYINTVTVAANQVGLENTEHCAQAFDPLWYRQRANPPDNPTTNKNYGPKIPLKGSFSLVFRVFFDAGDKIEFRRQEICKLMMLSRVDSASSQIFSYAFS